MLNHTVGAACDVGRERKGQAGDRTRDYPIHAGRSATELPSPLLEESSTPTCDTRGPRWNVDRSIPPNPPSLFLHMVYYMGRYFLIDPKTWSDDSKDPWGHAYHFMEFLLLGEMLWNEGPRDLPLDITQSHPATLLTVPSATFRHPCRKQKFA